MRGVHGVIGNRLSPGGYYPHHIYSLFVSTVLPSKLMEASMEADKYMPPGEFACDSMEVDLLPWKLVELFYSNERAGGISPHEIMLTWAEVGRSFHGDRWGVSAVGGNGSFHFFHQLICFHGYNRRKLPKTSANPYKLPSTSRTFQTLSVRTCNKSPPTSYTPKSFRGHPFTSAIN